MSLDVRVPELGESVVEATIGKWLKHEGDSVSDGEPVAELETEKVNVTVPAPAAGTVERILRPEGATVRPGEVIATIREAAQPAAPPAAVAPPPAAAPAPPVERVPAAPPVEERPPASPAVRRFAEEHDIDLTKVRGTGPRGRVTMEDVMRYLEERQREEAARAAVVPPAAAPPPPMPAPPPPRAEAVAPPAVPTVERREERVPMSRRRQTIARRLVEAQRTAAILTTFNEIDMTAVMELRRRRREEFLQRHGVRLGLMSFFTKAVIGALKAFPMLNAEIDGDEIVYKYYYDIGIAVAAPEGLVVPVVRNADRKTFAEIEREIEDLATRAREGKLTPQELVGGTFTITNGGVFGSLLSTPILNPPQVGILGMHKIEDRPIALNGQVVIRPMMYVALSYDHRLVDGREAVLFLVRVKELIEDPERLLLEG